MNIIMDENFILRFTGAKSNSYEPNELTFYIPNTFTDSIIYIVLHGDDMYDVLPLTFINDALHYKTYTLDGTKQIRATGNCEISVLLIKESKVKISQSFNVQLNIERYKISHQTYITQQACAYVADMYSKIDKMTNMNIEIYDQIMLGRSEGK